MATAPSSVTGIRLEFIEYPAVLTPPGSTNSYFLGGAGVRGVTITEEFVGRLPPHLASKIGQVLNMTTIGVYLEEKAIPFLAAKWKGKSPAELLDSLHFYRDIIRGPFEKIIRGSKLVPIDGPEYVRKVSENCVTYIKSAGTYGEAEEKAIEQFREAFKDQNFTPGSSVFYRQSPNGTLGVSFSKDHTIPEHDHTVIENKQLSEAVLETMIGEIPVTPALKESLATRFHEFLKEASEN